MKTVLYLSLALLVVVFASWAYRVNYATQEAMNRVADLRDEIAREKEALGVLDAEWAYLNRPDRLRRLVNANAQALGLVELTPEQFTDIALIAMPPDPLAEPKSDDGATPAPHSQIKPVPGATE